MRIIPVIDLKAGQVVRGVGGRRQDYQPITSQLTPSTEPFEVARALIEKFHPRELYLADLDAIAGATPDWESFEKLSQLAVNRWVDAGVRFPANAVALANAGIEGIVCGLESLASSEGLKECIRLLGPDRVIFSLDLKNGQAIRGEGWPATDPISIAKTALELGLRRLIVLDLADVGEARGVHTLELCSQILDAHPGIELIAGGGVRNRNDLDEMERRSIAAALVASALHDGRII